MLTLLLMLLTSIFPVATQAAEQLCATLGAACVCSEPLNTGTYNLVVGTTNYWNPADSTSNECSLDSEAGAVLSDAANSVMGSEAPISSGEEFTNLPSTATGISWVLAQNNGTTTSGTPGGQSLGTHFPAGNAARRSIRFYRYYSASPAHVWTVDAGSGLCNSGKIVQLGFNGANTGGPLLDFSPGGMEFYDVDTSFGWNNNMQGNCCVGQLGPDVAPASDSLMLGKWWRVEFSITNTDYGTGFSHFDMWVKNVTDNLPELHVIQSSQPWLNGPDSTHWWQSPMTDGLAVASGFNIRDMGANIFRSNNGNTCTGHISHMYFLAAAWATDSNQRIGAAIEVEGTGGVPGDSHRGTMRGLMHRYPVTHPGARAQTVQFVH